MGAPIKCILFNGPPGSGKDAAAQHLLDSWLVSFHLKFASERVINGLADIFKQPPNFFKSRGTKDFACLGDSKDLTPRDLIIDFFENIGKKYWGEDVWAQLCYDDIVGLHLAYETNDFVISDLGSTIELDTLAKQDDIALLVIRLHREGCNFDKDSRSYVDGCYGNVVIRDMVNCGTPKFFERVENECEGFFDL